MRLYYAILSALVIIGLVIPSITWAGDWKKYKRPSWNQTVNNHYHMSETNVYQGVSESDLARGISTALANSHKFDYGTTSLQGSVVGAWYEDENSVSFGLAKRFGEEDAFKLDALLHGSYTENGSTRAVVIGTTFRF